MASRDEAILAIVLPIILDSDGPALEHQSRIREVEAAPLRVSARFFGSKLMSTDCCNPENSGMQALTGLRIIDHKAWSLCGFV